MRSAQLRSLLRIAACLYFGPFIVIGGLALFALGFGALAVVVQLIAVVLKYAGL